MRLYDFKPVEELAWIALVTAAVAALQVVVATDLAAIVDWHAWAISLGAAVVRAAAGAILARLPNRTTAASER